MENRTSLKVGDSVVIDPDLLKSNEPQSWKNIANVTAIVKDEQLTIVSRIPVFRVEIKFETLPYLPTSDEIEMFGHVGCYTASVLPRLLRKL